MAKNVNAHADAMELSEVNKSTAMTANPCYGDWKPNEENEETTSTNQPTSAADIQYAVPEEPPKATVETKRKATKSSTPDPQLVPHADLGTIGKERFVSPSVIPRHATAIARCCFLTLLIAVAVGALVVALQQSSKPSSPGKAFGYMLNFKFD